ncbi:phosphate ABC transporter permease PstA [Nitrospinota bacterium]
MDRKFSGQIFESLCRGMTILASIVLLFVLGWIFLGGYRTITWDFLTAEPVEGMTRGGIFPAIFGTVSVTMLMLVMALPLGVGAAIYLVEYAGDGKAAKIIRAAVNNLAGVPSIVFGLFGVGFFVLFVGRNLDAVLGRGLIFGQPAMLWAAATLAVLTLPVVIVTTEEALRAIPLSLREGAYALGATRWQVIRGVVLPQALPGILTGAILSVSRGAGETAPILFTGAAYFLPRLPVAEIPWLGIPMINPLDQFMELAYHIFIMATQSTNPTETLPIQYGTTLVLVALTFMLNLTAIAMRFVFRRAVVRR